MKRHNTDKSSPAHRASAHQSPETEQRNEQRPRGITTRGDMSENVTNARDVSGPGAFKLSVFSLFRCLRSLLDLETFLTTHDSSSPLLLLEPHMKKKCIFFFFAEIILRLSNACIFTMPHYVHSR